MKTYTIKGQVKEIPYVLKKDDEFGIQAYDDGRNIYYLYNGDENTRKIEKEFVNLHDLILKIVFTDIDDYYNRLENIPLWVIDAGQNSDSEIGSDCFSKLVNDIKDPILYKYLYVNDYFFLVMSVQNLVISMEHAFVNFYKNLSEVKTNIASCELDEPNFHYITVSENTVQVSSCVETYFTKAHSILDMMCKICYELQFVQSDFTKYCKLKSAKILWGDRKKLDINNTPGTIFEKCQTTEYIEAIRNEIVHSGTWEMSPKVFIHCIDKKEVERYMLFPDMYQGHLATVRNRKHFFSSGTKVNDILPEIHRDFYNRMLKTIEVLRKKV